MTVNNAASKDGCCGKVGKGSARADNPNECTVAKTVFSGREICTELYFSNATPYPMGDRQGWKDRS